ncbi:MAG: Zn-dependent hydrolase [Saprospiraceae bacterium]|nr:Zn-dependent hydrolase [Saprospiraceae bacterium]
MKKLSILFLAILIFVACKNETTTEVVEEQAAELTPMQQNLAKYTDFTLTADLSHLSDNQKQIVKLLIEAADVMNELFWYEAYGDKMELLAGIKDADTKTFVTYNYGPWDRLDGNKPFVDGIGEKPAGANFYPKDMTKEEFEKAALKDGKSLYTFVRRDESGKLKTVWYHEMFPEQIKKVAGLLRQASELAEDAGFKKYLSMRAEALETDKYLESDYAWMAMKGNMLEVVIGPIENYEDQLFGAKAAHEGYVLIKDMEWSKKLEKYAAFLPELQKNLPVADAYKQDRIGSNVDLNAYDVVYYAGDCNSGSKTIAINLPNDIRVQTRMGSRRLQLKNAMKAKFDKILLPLSEVLIDPTQRQYITFDAFFANTMFHEVAHGLGIKNTINGKGEVGEALKELTSALEEGKADVLGLYMITQLHKKGEIDGDLKEYYTTFIASIFRSIRFGASSAHGKANMIRFNYFQEKGAFSRNDDGTYTIHYDKMEDAMNSLSELILTLQGNGDYEGVAKLVKEKGVISKQLQADLDGLMAKGIPVDVVYKQGIEVLGL